MSAEKQNEIDAWAERVFGKRVSQSRRVRLRDNKATAKADFDKLFLQKRKMT